MRQQEQAMRKRGWFSVRSAAAIAKVNPLTVYKWVHEGRIASRRIGGARGRIYISMASLREMLGPLASPVPK